MEVEIIKANSSGEDISNGRRIDRLRVAAYCRVSTDDEDQIKSYNSMVRYYTDLIKSNKQWVFAGVFADKAITGTKTDKREEFQLLIQECLSGNIDMVIAKSIPRFARNTLDTLKYVRMLRERNIAVYFEVEKINTLKDGEFLLTILSSVAQQEVENTSAYVKKGLKMKMKRGELVGFQGCLGYDYDVVTKSLSVNEEGAETVRYIFDRYVAGAGSTMIARELNEQGIPTIRGNPWTSSSVMGIINNEKYKGDILLGKTFTVDPISKRRLENLGEEDRFYIKNHHEAIISEETFARAQEIRERRNGGRKKGVVPGKREKFSRQYAFSCMLECGFCGANLSRRRWHSSSKYTKTIWQCVESTKHGKRFCPDSKGIPEQVIEDAFIESYRMLCMDHKDVLEEFIKRVEKTLLEDSIEDKIEKLNRSVYNIQYKRKKLLENYLEGVVAKDIYEETDMGYEKKLSEAKSQLSMLEQQYDNEGSLQRRLADFKKALSKNQVLEEFDRGIFESTIEKVIVGGYDENGEKDPYKIIFIYKTGFKNEIGNAKERFGKKSKAVETAKEMCSHIADEVKNVCSYASDNTCGDSLPSVKKSPINQRFLRFWKKNRCVFLFPQSDDIIGDLPQGLDFGEREIYILAKEYFFAKVSRRCRMEEHNELDVLSETNYIDVLKDILETFMNEATDIAVQVMNSDIVQDGTEILSQVGEAVSGAIKSLKVAHKIASIPTALYMKKFERYCKGLTTIPLEKRQKYMKLLGKEKFNKESVFVLNVINRIEENEKIPLFLKILNAKMDGFIDDNEYHRLMILTDRTLYSDLLYLKDNITEDPVKLNSDSDYGLASSGLLVAAGNEWVEGMDDADNGVRFNYTLAAKKMAYIFFGVECAMKPSNKGITILVAASNEEVEEQLNELFK